MDILKTATDWTRAEVLSSAVFVVFGLMFLAASFGFWQLGKTDVARAYTIPTLLAGGLLVILGVGLLVPSFQRIEGFAAAYGADSSAFVTAELARSEKVLNEYRIAVFRVIPLMVATCAILIMLLDCPLWRASLITIVAILGVILVVDTNAHARLEAYHTQLERAAKQQR